MHDVFAGMKRFQTDRGLDEKEFNLKDASMNILEELLEIHGVKDDEHRAFAGSLYQDLMFIVAQTQQYYPQQYEEPTVDMMLDGFCDIIEYAFGEPYKLGYESVICLDEMQREINSRSGVYKNGKFHKDLSSEAKSRWYKANYSLAKIKSPKYKTGSLFDTQK